MDEYVNRIAVGLGIVGEASGLAISADGTTVRLSAGSGYRNPLPVVEHAALLAGAVVWFQLFENSVNGTPGLITPWEAGRWSSGGTRRSSASWRTTW